MLGWIFFGASVIAASTLGNGFAIGNAVLNFWSLGIMHNYKNEPYVHPHERPWVMVNMITSVIGLVLFAISMAS